MGYFVKNQKTLQIIVYQLLCCFFFPLFDAVMFRLWVQKTKRKALKLNEFWRLFYVLLEQCWNIFMSLNIAC